MAEVFLKPGTMDPLLEGDTCRNTRLAATLRRVADEGAGILREGPLAESLAQDIRDAGGIVTAADLAQYRPRIMAPLRAQAMGFTLLGMPPPSSGGAAVAQVLEFLGGYARPLSSPGTLGTHRLAEAFKNAFAMRMNLGDPEAALPNLAAALADMLSPSFNSELRTATLDNATRPATAYGAQWNQLDDSGTTHLCVVDAERNAVSMTSTINTEFGSKVVSPSTGIVLNNEMDDFSSPGVRNHYGLAPSEANFIAPRKRPLSSMSPTIVIDESSGTAKVFAVAGASGRALHTYCYLGCALEGPWMCLACALDVLCGVTQLVSGTNGLNCSLKGILPGRRRRRQQWCTGAVWSSSLCSYLQKALASGGPRIITATAQVLLNVIARGMDPLAAVNTPRIHHQLIPDIVYAEEQRCLGDGPLRRVPEEEVAGLRARGRGLHSLTFQLNLSRFGQPSPYPPV
jgi:gamma-glutamyltranspeptidase